MNSVSHVARTVRQRVCIVRTFYDLSNIWNHFFVASRNICKSWVIRATGKGGRLLPSPLWQQSTCRHPYARFLHSYRLLNEVDVCCFDKSVCFQIAVRKKREGGGWGKGFWEANRTRREREGKRERERGNFDNVNFDITLSQKVRKSLIQLHQNIEIKRLLSKDCIDDEMLNSSTIKTEIHYS